MDAGKEFRTFLDDPKEVKKFLERNHHSAEKLNKDVTFVRLCNLISSKGIEIFEDPLFDGLDTEAKAAILLLSLQNEIDKPKVKERDDDIAILLNKVIEEIESPIKGIANTNFRSLFEIIHTSKDHDALASYLTLLSMEDREPTTKAKKGEVLEWLIEASRKDFTLSELLSYIDIIHSLGKDVITTKIAEQLKTEFLRTMKEFNINKLADKDLIDLSTRVAQFVKGGVINERQASTLINKFMNKVTKNANVLKDMDYEHVLPFMSAPSDSKSHPLLAFIENNRRGAWMVINDVADVNDEGQHNALLRSMLELQIKQKNFADVKSLGKDGKVRNGLFAALEAAKGYPQLQVDAFNEISKAREAKTAIVDDYWTVGRDGDLRVRGNTREALDTANAAFQSVPVYNNALHVILKDKNAAKALYDSVKGDAKKLKALLSLEPIFLSRDTEAKKQTISGLIYTALSPEEKAEFIANPVLAEPLEAIYGRPHLALSELVNKRIYLSSIDDRLKDLEPEVKQAIAVRILSAFKGFSSNITMADQRNLYDYVLPALYEHIPPYNEVEASKLVLNMIKVQNASDLGTGARRGWETMYPILEKNKEVPIIGMMGDNVSYRPYNALLTKIIDQQIKEKAFVKEGVGAAKGITFASIEGDKLVIALQQIGDPELNLRVFDEINRAMSATKKPIDTMEFEKVRWHVMNDPASVKALYARVQNNPKELAKLLDGTVTDPTNKVDTPISLLIYQKLTDEQRLEFLGREQVNPSEIFNIVPGKATNWGKLTNDELIDFSIQVAKLKESGAINEKEAYVLINRFMNSVKKDANVLKGKDDFYKHVLPLISQNKPHPLLAFIENNRAGAWMVINDFAKDEVASVYGKEQHDALLKEMLQLQVEKNNFKDVKGGKGLLKALEAAKDDSDLQIKVFNAIAKERTNQVPILKIKKKGKDQSSYRASQEALGYDQALVAILSNKKAVTALYDSVKDNPKKFKELLQIDKEFEIVTNFTISKADGNISGSRRIESFIYEALDAEKKAEFIRNSPWNPLSAVLQRGGDNFASEIYYNFTNSSVSFPKPLADLDGEVKKAFADRIIDAINSFPPQFTKHDTNREWFYKHVLPYAQHELIIKFIAKENAIAQKPEQVWGVIYAIFEHDQMKADTALLTKIIDQQIKDKKFSKDDGYSAVEAAKLTSALKQIDDYKLNLRVFDEINRVMATTKTTVVTEGFDEFQKILWHIMHNQASVQELYNRVKDKPKELAKLLDGTVIDPTTEAKISMSSLIYQQLTDEQKAEFLEREQVNPFEVINGLGITEVQPKKPGESSWVGASGAELIQSVAAVINSSLTPDEKAVLTKRILAHIDYKKPDFFGKPTVIPDTFAKALGDIGDPALNVKVFKVLAAGREKLIKGTANFTKQSTTEEQKNLSYQGDALLLGLLNDEVTVQAIYKDFKDSDVKMKKLLGNTPIKQVLMPYGEFSVDYLLYINSGLDENTVVKFLQNKYVDPMKILLDIHQDNEADIFNYVGFISSYISAFPETKRYVDSFNKDADPILLQIPNDESIRAKSMLELILKVDGRNNNQYLITKFATEVLVKDPKVKASAAIFDDRVKAIAGIIDSAGLDPAQKHDAKIAVYSAIMQDPAARTLALNANLVERDYMLLAALKKGGVEAERVFKDVVSGLGTPNIDRMLKAIQANHNVDENLKATVMSAALAFMNADHTKKGPRFANRNMLSLDLSTPEGTKLMKEFVQYTKVNDASQFRSELLAKIGASDDKLAKAIAHEVIHTLDVEALKGAMLTAIGHNKRDDVTKFITAILDADAVDQEKVRAVLRYVAKEAPAWILSMGKIELTTKQQAAIPLGFADIGGKATDLVISVLYFLDTGSMSISLTDAESIIDNFDVADPAFVKLLSANTTAHIIANKFTTYAAAKLAKELFIPVNPDAFNKFMVGVYEELVVSPSHAKQFLNENPGALFKAAIALKDAGVVDKLVEDLNAIKGAEKDEDFIRRVFASLDAETSMDKTDILDIKHRLFASQMEHTVGNLEETWKYVGENFKWIFELLHQSELERVIDGIISDSRAPRNGETVQKSIISTLTAALTEDTVDEKALSIVIRMLNYSIGQGMLVNGLVELTKEMDEKDIRAFNEEITKIADNEVRKAMRTALFNAIMDNELFDALVEIATVNTTEGKTPSDHMKLDEIGRNAILAVSDLLLLEVHMDAAKAISADLFKDINEDGLKELLDAAKEKSPELAAFMAEQKPELFATISSTSRTADSVFTYGDMYVFDKIIQEDGLTAVEAAERLLAAYNDPANKGNKNLRTAIEEYYSKYVQQGLGKDDLDVEEVKKASPELIAKFFRKAAELENAAKPKEEVFEFTPRREEAAESISVTMEGVKAATPITTRPENLLVFEFKLLANIHEELAKKTEEKPSLNLIAELFYTLIAAVSKFISTDDKELFNLAKSFESVLAKEIQFEDKVKQDEAPKHTLELEEKIEEIVTGEEPKGFAARVAQKAGIVKKGISPEEMKEESKGEGRESRESRER